MAVAFCCACNRKHSADMILHHALIYTVDSNFSTVTAMAVRDGKVLALGTDKDIMGSYESAEVVDAGGKAVYPGFIDAHAHFTQYGQALFSVNLFGCQSWDEAVERVKQFAAGHPDLPWITGWGWDQNKFAGKQFPDNGSLNAAFATRPVVLERVDGHALIANEKALGLAGIHAGDTLTGGVVETRKNALTGILVDNAMGLVYRAMPRPSPGMREQQLMAAQQNCFSMGLTTVTECGLGKEEILTIDSLQKAGKLRMRVYAMVRDNKDDLDYFIPKGPYKTDYLYVKGVKALADGALGSRGACLLQPYSDRAGWYGFLLHTAEHYDSLAKLLAETDFQLCTHAIGDSANRAILQIYNRRLGGKNDKRWRIEHAQIVNEGDFGLFGKSSIIPSVQPTHATSDMYWAAERLGTERLKGGYALQRLLHENGWLPLGTDFPVEDISPYKTFLAAVFRVDAKGFPAGGFQPENALTREQTIRGMTIWAAKADCLEKEIGSLEQGKRADFVILDRDLMTVKAEEVLQTKVVSCYSNGVRRYKS